MKTDNLAQELRQRIVTGEFKPGDRFPSEYELANQYQVNKDTANRAVGILVLEGFLQRKGRGAGTYVRKVDVYPKGTIAIVNAISHTFFSTMTAGAAVAAEKTGYLAALYCPPPDQLYETMARIVRAGIKGVITSRYGLLGQELGEIPLIYLDRTVQPVNAADCNLVLNDDYKGGRLQAETLLKYGHRNIVYVSQITGDERNCGFRDCLLKNGIADAADRIFVPDGVKPHYPRLLTRILAKYPSLTGLACSSDDDVAALIRAATFAGFDLLEKFSVIGYGNVVEISERYHLTTIEQHPAELGAVACQRLVEMIEGRRPRHGLYERCDVELKPGASVSRVVPASAQGTRTKSR